MNEDRLKDQWQQLAGKVRTNWGKLNDRDLQNAEGSGEYLEAKIQERFSSARETAKRQVKAFNSRI